MNQLVAFIIKNKKAVAIVLIIIVIAVIFYRKGKNKTTIADLPKDEPSNGETGNGGVNLSGSQVSVNQLALYASLLYDDITCFFCSRNGKLYADLALLSDTDLVKLYNVYNTMYQSKLKETMLQSLQNEVTDVFFSAQQNMASIIKRLQKYNLK